MAAEDFPYSRILIPYDGSPGGQRALEWAAHLARTGGKAVQQVTLLRVIGGGYLARHIQNVDLRVRKMDQEEAWQRVRQHHLDQVVRPLLEEGRKFLLEHGVTAPVDTGIAEGKIGDEIIGAAAAGEYDALVMGRRGLSPMAGWFLGSVTRQVLNRAHKTTVFVVGPEATFQPENPLSPMLLPVDGSETGLAAVRQGAALAAGWRDGRPRLTLLHVIDFAKLGESPGEAGTRLAREGEESLAAARQVLAGAGLADRGVDRSPAGEPARVIAAEAEEGGYALILMGARGLSPLGQMVLGSISHEVVHRVSGPVVGIVYP
jgi:nucleotide-binding universal stress UspA family protein